MKTRHKKFILINWNLLPDISPAILENIPTPCQKGRYAKTTAEAPMIAIMNIFFIGTVLDLSIYIRTIGRKIIKLILIRNADTKDKNAFKYFLKRIKYTPARIRSIRSDST
jgi:hypothetical protein